MALPRMTNEDMVGASNALIDWFKSQDIQPADATYVMLGTIVTQLLHNTKDKVELNKAVFSIAILMKTQIEENINN